MTSFVPARAAAVPPSARMFWKFRTVPTWKMSYHPPLFSAGTITFSQRFSTSSRAQNES